MAERIIMPKQGLQMTEGTITQWLAKEGDAISMGQPLFEMETDKLTIQMDATAAGTLLKILHPAGDVVPITKTIAWVGTPGEAIPSENQAAMGMPQPAAPQLLRNPPRFNPMLWMPMKKTPVPGSGYL